MRKRYYGLMAGLVAVLLAGCGQKQEAPAASADTQAAAKTGKAEEEEPEATGGELKLSGRHWKIGGQVRQTSLYLYYARDMGLFEDAGLDVEIVTLSNGPALNEALNAGEIEAAANGMAAVYVLPTENFYYVGDTTINFGGQAMYGRTDSDIVKAGLYKDTRYYGSPESVSGANILGLGAGPQSSSLMPMRRLWGWIQRRSSLRLWIMPRHMKHLSQGRATFCPQRRRIPMFWRVIPRIPWLRITSIWPAGRWWIPLLSTEIWQTSIRMMWWRF